MTSLRASDPSSPQSTVPLGPVHLQHPPHLLAFGFHLFTFFNLSHSLWLAFQFPTVTLGSPSPNQDVVFGGPGLFLTIWALVLTWLDFALKLLICLPSPFPNFLQQILSILNLIALSLETLITLLYWPIILYDSSLMIPPPPAVPPPLTVDLALHLLPTIFLWIDHLCFAPLLETKYANLILIIFTIIYTTWIEAVAFYANNNNFPYPFLTMASRPIRYLIYAFAIILCRIVLYLATWAAGDVGGGGVRV